jgi:ABC-type transport system substrate-binding protein
MATSQEQYAKKIKEAEEILIEEMPFTCLYHENFVFLLSPRVQHFAVSPLGHIYFDHLILK